MTTHAAVLRCCGVAHARYPCADLLANCHFVPAASDTFSFAAQSTKTKRGVVFGAKLKTRFEIDQKLGIGQGPAPGGTIPSGTFSFVAQSQKQNKGVVFGNKLPDRAEIDRKLGIFNGPAPGGDIPMDVFSFTAANRSQKKGVVFGSKLKDRREIEEKLGIFHGPAPGGDIPGMCCAQGQVRVSTASCVPVLTRICCRCCMCS